MGKNVSTTRFLALLRGINVGGHHLISKDDLRELFEDLDFTNVRTYIQSGNILFRAPGKSVKRLTKTITSGLSQRFSYEAQATVFSYEQYHTAVGLAPKGWGQSDLQKHNALFTLENTPADDILAELPAPKQELESVSIAPGVIFWSASKKHLGKTTMMKLASSPIYKQVTVRNHNTVIQLLKLFEEI